MSDQDSIDGLNFCAIGLSNGQNGTFGMVMLWNPPNSGRLLLVRRVVIIGTFPTTTAFDLRKSNVQLGTPLVPPRTFNKRFTGPTSVAQVSNYDSATIPGTPPMHEFWIGTPNTDHTYDFGEDPYIVDPGWGIFTAAASTGGYNITTWHYKELTPA